MKPVHFKEVTNVLAKPASMTDDECSSLPIYTDGVECVSCWKMSWKERIKALLFGKIWLLIMSGHTQPPVLLVCEDTVFEKEEANE